MIADKSRPTSQDNPEHNFQKFSGLTGALFKGLIFGDGICIGHYQNILINAYDIHFLYYLSRYEEKLLLKRFGDGYRTYMREVGMWTPRLRRK